MLEQPDDEAGGSTPRGAELNDWESIASYLGGEDSPEEREALEARVLTDARFRAHLEIARLAWTRAPGALGAPVTRAEIEAAWSRLSAEMAEEQADRAPIPSYPGEHRLRFGHRRPRTAFAWRPAAIAASVLLALGLGIARLRPMWLGMGAPSTVALQMRDFSAGSGQRLRVRLGDGTEVVLAPGSRLRAPVHFGSNEREVALTGRAYFEVTHAPDRPFLVRAGGTTTRVLGTRFEVRAYPADEKVDVVVRSGRVAVRPDVLPVSAARILGPGDLAILDRVGTVAVRPGADVDALLAWTTGKLVFRRTPLRDVVLELDRWFNVQIDIADPALAQRRLTAEFNGESLDVVLRTVAELVDARMERQGRHISLSPKPPR